jgi:hypothetical protein
MITTGAPSGAGLFNSVKWGSIRFASLQQGAQKRCRPNIFEHNTSLSNYSSALLMLLTGLFALWVAMLKDLCHIHLTVRVTLSRHAHRRERFASRPYDVILMSCKD